MGAGKIKKTDQEPHLADFTAAIMSFNRGDYLKNCALSCLENLPGCKVVIYDDQSDDPYTLSVLSELAQMGCEVVTNTDADLQERHGGLYTNMQMALNKCATDYLIFLQDDTQVVRFLESKTAQTIRDLFADPDIAFVRSQFFKQHDIARFAPDFNADHHFEYLAPTHAYDDCDKDHAYCDVMIADVEKLRAVNWQFRHLERDNQYLAKKYFKYMPYLWHPFVFYCPEVPSYRDRKLYLASRIVQRKRRGILVTFNRLEGTLLDAFISRSKGDWPIAENFLTTNIADIKKPFVFQDYAKTPWLYILYKVESRLWRMVSPILRILNIK